MPTISARRDETLYFHGAVASRTLKTLATGVDVCLTVTLMDGMVLARSAFHHSMNYRSVVVLGNARLVQEPEERMLALKVITDHAVPGRWDEVRGPNDLELKQTSVLALPLEEVSAKVRSGPPVDDDEDYSLPVWAGVVPFETRVTKPLDDGRVLPGVAPPDLARFQRVVKPAK
jgi:nitroimidazol reductase NimA-like FMN-containing flavoprotein (pyridoxamine 5'-phosphate oxidase superfamily)